MIVKNTTQDSIPLNGAVQIDVQTPDNDDGYVLPGQTVDLSKSMTATEIQEHEQLREAINAGTLVFVVDGVEQLQSRSVSIYNSGAGEWAKAFDDDLSNQNLRAGISSGFIYAIECRIG